MKAAVLESTALAAPVPQAAVGSGNAPRAAEPRSAAAEVTRLLAGCPAPPLPATVTMKIAGALAGEAASRQAAC